MTNLSIKLAPENSAYTDLIDDIAWEGGVRAGNLRVIPEIGCLAMSQPGVGDEEYVTLLTFSNEQMDQAFLHVPESLADLPPEQQNFNTDPTAKGLGISTANTPEGLFRKDDIADIVAVRGIPLIDGLHSIFVANSSEALPGQAYRYVRHGLLYLAAEGVDRATHSLRGTEAAMRHMERPYGDRQVAVLPTPPSWRLEQRREGIVHAITPRKVLARGHGLSGDLPLLGTYSVENLHRK